MSIQRKFERDQIRKKYGNKALNSIWKQIRKEKIRRYIDSMETDKNKETLFKRMWNKITKKISNATKKKNLGRHK